MLDVKDLEREIDRARECLLKLSPDSGSYSRCLSSIRTLLQLREFVSGSYIEWPQDEPIEEEEGEEVVEPEPVEPEPVEEKKEEKELEPEPEPKEDEPITREYVRALLADAASRGIHIQPIIAKFVPEDKALKLSSVPASSYPELIEEVKNAN